MVSGSANMGILILVTQITVNDKVFSLAASTPGKVTMHWTGRKGEQYNHSSQTGKLKILIPLQRIKQNFSSLQITSQDGLLRLLAEVCALQQ